MNTYSQKRQQLAVCIEPSGNSVKACLPTDTGFETTPLWGLAFALTLTGNVAAFFRAFCQLSFTPAVIQP